MSKCIIVPYCILFGSSKNKLSYLSVVLLHRIKETMGATKQYAKAKAPGAYMVTPFGKVVPKAPPKNGYYHGAIRLIHTRNLGKGIHNNANLWIDGRRAEDTNWPGPQCPPKSIMKPRVVLTSPKDKGVGQTTRVVVPKQPIPPWRNPGAGRMPPSPKHNAAKVVVKRYMKKAEAPKAGPNARPKGPMGLVLQAINIGTKMFSFASLRL